MFESLLSLLFASSMHVQSPMTNELNNFDDRSLLEVNIQAQMKEDAAALAPLSAESFLAIDLASNMPLVKQNHSTQRPIASLTKLMTAHIILKENALDEIVTVSAHAASMEGSSMELVAGEKISVRHLLHGLMIESGNDAATALAEYNGGTIENFVNKMNNEAKALGMQSTSYANPSGLDHPNAYSTAQDLAMLSKHVLKNQTLRKIVNQESFEFLAEDGTAHKLQNTNVLLGQLGVRGLKTGRTEGAGECFISLARTAEGHEVLTIVLGSEQRFPDTQILLEWIYDSFTW